MKPAPPTVERDERTAAIPHKLTRATFCIPVLLRSERHLLSQTTTTTSLPDPTESFCFCLHCLRSHCCAKKQRRPTVPAGEDSWNSSVSHCGWSSDSHAACVPHEGGDSCVRGCSQTSSGSLQQTKAHSKASLRIPLGAPPLSNRCHHDATTTVSPTCSSEQVSSEQDLDDTAREDQQSHRRSPLPYHGLAACRQKVP